MFSQDGITIFIQIPKNPNMGHKFEMYSGLLGSLLVGTATVVKGYDGITQIKLDFPSSFSRNQFKSVIKMLN
jgi:hypothetical protein